MSNRYKDQAAFNDLNMEAVDAGFLGVNTQLDPGLLKTGAAYSDVNQQIAGPGMCSHAVNMRFRRGIAETRAGSVAPTWCNPRNPDVALADAGIVNTVASKSPVLHPTYGGVLAMGGGKTYWLPRLAADVNSKAAYQWKQADGLIGNLEYDGTKWRFRYWPDTVAGSANATSVAVSQPTASDPWDATWPAGTSIYDSPWVTPWSEPILAAAQFADPNGTESLMLVFPSGVYQCREGATPKLIGLPEGTELAAPIELLQTFDSMVLLRGLDLAPLAWDGNAAAFEPIPLASPNGDYTASIPPSSTGAVMNNRLMLVFGRDTIAVSDILNFTRYDDALSAFRINSGEDDAITAIFPFRRTNLLVFKQQSIHLIGNVTGDLSDVVAEIVNSEVGCPAPKSIAAVGGDVFFLSDDGVFRISEVVEQSMQVQESPVSEPVDTIIRRINWNAIATAWAVAHGDYYRLALPIDGSDRPNIVLVYDTVRGSWQGYDEYPDGFNPEILGRTNSLGRKHAYAIDKARAVVAILDQGTTDVEPVAVTDTYASLTTSFSGDNNDLTLTARTSDAAGNNITAEFVVQAGKADDVEVVTSGTDITVTAGGHAQIIVSGTLESNGLPNVPVTFTTFTYLRTTNGKPEYQGETSNHQLFWTGTEWFLGQNIPLAVWTSSSNTATPDLATGWLPYALTSTGTPTFTALSHTAAQVKAAIEADTDANALVAVTYPTGNDGTGQVGTLAQTNLSGGFNGSVLVFPAVVTEQDITSEVQTRGYILLDDGPKRFRHGMVTLETWNPSYTIQLVTDGINEVETVIGPKTKDRTKYYLHGKADYDATNTNHDHDAPKREDYSVILPDGGLDMDTGISTALAQQCQEQFVVRRLGQWCAIKITNTQGRFALKNSSMDGQNRRNISKTFA